jgi:hypothetical protein
MWEILASILGAFLVYFVWLRQRAIERAERRQNLATALLIELKSMDWVLRSIYRDEKAALSLGELPMPLLARLDDGVLGFEPQTVFELLSFRGYCEGVRILRARAQGMAKELVDDARHRHVQSTAGLALQLLPEIKLRLEAEGGVVMPRKSVRSLAPFKLPEIPVSPFHLDDEDETARRLE